MKQWLFYLFAFIVCSSTALATPVTIDIEDLSPEDAAQVLQLKKTAEAPVIPELPPVPPEERVEKWVSIGNQIGQAIGGACKELGVAVNDFIVTPAGVLTVTLIVWEVVGEDLWGIIGGTLAWISIMALVYFSVRHFHMNARVKDKATGKVEYISRYDFESRYARGTSAAVHGVAAVLFTIICLVIVF